MSLNFIKKPKVIVASLLLLISAFYYVESDFIFSVDSTPSKHTERITVLTGPVGSSDCWYHPAVTKSLLRGLEKLEIDFNYNPMSIDEIGQTIVVLTNTHALKQAIAWKRSGKVKKILAGPNHVDAPNDNRGIILSPELDMYLLPGKFVKAHFLEDAPQLNIGVWPSGVDTNFWNPVKKADDKTNNKVLVYWKTESELFCKRVEQVLRKNGWDPIRIKYGSYDHTSYKQTLQDCLFAVFISRSETQGIALAECWSMNVPTLVWDPRESWRSGEFTYRNRKYSEVSACPYLNEMLGQRWETVVEFETLLTSIKQTLPDFSPRSWTVENMSDTASASILISLINNIQ